MAVNRITGMYSGMDTDALVKALTMTQQGKIDALDAKIKKAEWKKDILTDFNNKLRVFRETYGSIQGGQSLMTTGAFTAFAIKMPENSGVQVTASSQAKAGAYSVRVDQLASAAAMKGTKLTNRVSGLTDAELNSTAVGALSLSDRNYLNGEIRFSINGQTFSFSANTSLKQIMDNVNKADIGVTMAYSQMTDSITVTGSKTGAYAPPPGATAAQLEAYDKANADKQLSFTDDTGFLDFIGISGVTEGQDAIVYLNGSSDPRYLDTNTITMDGITMSFLRPTDPGGVNFTLEADYAPAVARIKAFVESYNELMKDLYTAYNQKVNRDYQPLTEAQKDTMSEKEIEVWESKAQEGLLYRDNTLGRLLENMRGLLSKTLGGAGNLSSLGITTGRYMAGEPVQLELDEDKLKAALQTDSDRVYSIFSATAKDGHQGGLVTQLNKLMDDYIGTVKGRDIQNLNNNIRDYSKNIKEQEDKLAVMSEKYYLQYAKLETALSQLQSQQDSLSALYGWNTNQ